LKLGLRLPREFWVSAAVLLVIVGIVTLGEPRPISSLGLLVAGYAAFLVLGGYQGSELGAQAGMLRRRTRGEEVIVAGSRFLGSPGMEAR
jgi:hypothetical protein